MPHRQVEQCRGVVLSRTARAASTSALGSELCELCSANKGTNGTTGSTACECKDTFVTTSNGECTCSPGYTLENGVCVLCVPGFFKNTTSTDVCKKCNSPLDGVGIEGLVSSLAPATSYLYCTCSPREFRVSKPPDERGFEGQCLDCPEGADCFAGAITVESLPLKEGYWRSGPESSKVVECYTKEACRGINGAGASLKRSAQQGRGKCRRLLAGEGGREEDKARAHHGRRFEGRHDAGLD